MIFLDEQSFKIFIRILLFIWLLGTIWIPLLFVTEMTTTVLTLLLISSVNIGYVIFVLSLR